MTTGAKSDYLESKWLDHEFGTGTYGKPSNHYVALFTAAPTDSGGGTEVSGGAYARVAYGPNSVTAGNWTLTSDGTGQASNANAVAFPKSTAAWGTVVAFALFDSATGGNMKYWGVLDASQSIGVSTTASFDPGTLKILED